MSRLPTEATIAGLKVKSAPLKFELSQALLPDATDFVTRGIRELAPLIQFFKGGKDAFLKMSDEDFVKLVVGFVPKMNPTELRELMRVLNANAAKVLSSTTVIAPDAKGELTIFDMSKDKDRADIFEEYPQAYVPMVVFAGKVTFGRFFPELGLRAKGTPSA